MQPYGISEPVHAEPSLSEIQMTLIVPKPEPPNPNRQVEMCLKREVYR